jgi:methionyl-tRNA synthetase
MNMKRTLITSALPYANGFIHLGHCAGAYLPADIFARYLRLKGEEVLYVCGSDEHGVAITIAADKEKVTPKEIIDKYHYANKEAFEKLGMSFDVYSRTSNELHHGTAGEFFKDFFNKGYFSEREEDQFFDNKANMFLPDRYVEGICPNCGFDHARGDQCDSCGAYYDQLELKSPKSLVSGDTPVVKKTTHWYMRFDLFQKFLEDYIEGHAKEWKDNVIQQSRSWLKQGLAERAITRDLSWGIPLPDFDGIPAEKREGKAIYVWFEAVLGYITATREYMLAKGEGNADDWKTWWKDAGTRYVAFIGKDNIVFHTLIFPAMLNAFGDGYILPDNVPANEFLNLEGQKFSKSRNWSIDLRDFINDFPQTDKIDALRYTLAMNFPETKDADFTWKDFQARNNNELSAIFGNFVNRSLQFIHKNYEGKIPTLTDEYKEFDNEWHSLADSAFGNPSYIIDKNDYKLLNDNDILLIQALSNGLRKISENYDKFRFRDAISETMNIARAANKYFNDEEPWKTAKSNPVQSAKTLYVCGQLVRTLAIVFAPIVPNTCEKINKVLGYEGLNAELTGAVSKQDYWKNAIFPSIPQGRQTLQPELLFAKIEDDVIQHQISLLGDKQAVNEVPAEDLITIDDFAKVKLRTGIVVEAENVKKSKKLIRMIVDLGTEKRQVLAGVAEHYKPEELLGKTIVVVANLQPAKLMGMESQGMMLAASNAEGKLCFLTPEKDGIGAGAEVR